MGNTCCQDGNIKTSIAEDIQKRTTTPSLSNQYYETQMPRDGQLELRIDQIKKKETFSLIFQNNKIMKHKYFDKYYIGKWNNKGQPFGLGVMFEPENYIYHGQFKILPDGIGTIELLKQNLIYEGEIKDGRGQGLGKLTSRDNKIQFQGTMENTLPKTGSLRINNLNDDTKSYTIQLTDYFNQPVKIHYEDGRIYQGYASKRSFSPFGKGTASFSDGSRYEGQWEQGQMHGNGAFYWKDGSSYIGEYQHGRKHGNGTFTYVSKKVYIGQWAGGKQNGKGKLINQHGEVIKQGNWKDGVFEKNDLS